MRQIRCGISFALPENVADEIKRSEQLVTRQSQMQIYTNISKNHFNSLALKLSEIANPQRQCAVTSTSRCGALSNY